jgi:hypothetical protein
MCRLFHRYHALPFLALFAITLVVSLACGGTKPAPDGEIVATVPAVLTASAGTVEAQPAKSLDGPELTSESADLQLLESVIRQNSAARENIHSLYLDYSWRQDQTFPEMPIPGGTMPSGRVTEEGTSKLWKKGDNYHQDFSRRRKWHDAGIATEERFIIVLGETYFIEYHDLPKIVMFYSFDNRRSLYEPVSRHSVGYPSPDPLDFGFALGYGTIEEHYTTSIERHPGYFQWSIARETDGDEHYFRITRTGDVQGDPYLAEEILVAGDRGFLTTQYRDLARDGTLFRSIDCGLQLIAEGVWFPKTVTIIEDNSYSTLQIDVKQARVNCAIDNNMFTLPKTDFDPTNVILHEYAPGGRLENKKAFWDGQWIPTSMIPTAERPRSPDAREVMEQLGAQFD